MRPAPACKPPGGCNDGSSYASQSLLDEGHSQGGKVPWEEVFQRVLGSRESVSDDAQLPRTGLPLEWERQLSPVFLEPLQHPSGHLYGTCSQTVLAVHRVRSCLTSSAKKTQPGMHIALPLSPSLVAGGQEAVPD